MDDLTKALALSRSFRITDGNLDDGTLVAAATGGGVARALKEDRRLLAPATLVDGKYTVLALLGTGGMGAVYRARHLQLNREVALKTFLNGEITSEAWLRFQREVRAIARLDDTNIVKVFDFGIDQNNRPYYTMELLDGLSLAEKLAIDGALPREQTLTYFIAVARGLLHAHHLKMIHRDIKPANIFICNNVSGGAETIKVVDFGIAKLLTDQDMDSQKLTSTGLIFGSPLYMSPEQSLGLDTDERSDIYSFGCALYEALTGKPPFTGPSPFATILMHQQQAAPKLIDKHPDGRFEQRLESLVSKLLAKQPERRYQSFEQVLEALQEVATNNVPLPAKASASLEPSAGIKRAEEVQQVQEAREVDEAGEGLDLRWLKWAIPLIALGACAIVAIAAQYLKSTPPHKETSVLKPATVAEAAPPVISHLPLSGPYLHQVLANGDRVYQFPTDKSLGTIAVSNIQNFPRQKAMGKVVIPKYGGLDINLDPVVAVYPELLVPFNETDLNSLHCRFGSDLTDEHFDQIGKLTSLTSLKLIGASISSRNMARLATLSHIGDLELPDCQCRADDILKLPWLQRLVILDLDSTGPMSAVVRVLSTGIYDLSLANCQLTDADLVTISKMKKIIHLKIGQNNFSNSGLKLLIKMPNLRNLDLEGIKLGPESIDIFKKMHLVQLKVNTESWSPADKARLKNSLPGCEIKGSGSAAIKKNELER